MNMLEILKAVFKVKRVYANIIKFNWMLDMDPDKLARILHVFGMNHKDQEEMLIYCSKNDNKIDNPNFIYVEPESFEMLVHNDFITPETELASFRFGRVSRANTQFFQDDMKKVINEILSSNWKVDNTTYLNKEIDSIIKVQFYKWYFYVMWDQRNKVAPLQPCAFNAVSEDHNGKTSISPFVSYMLVHYKKEFDAKLTKAINTPLFMKDLAEQVLEGKNSVLREYIDSRVYNEYMTKK